MSTQLLDRPTTTDGTGDDGLAHYIAKKDLDAAWYDGVLIPTLCGKRITARKDMKGRPVCGECQDLWEQLPERGDES